MLAGAAQHPAAAEAPGRSCPLHYRYRPEVFASAAPPELQNLEVLYVVGGLYGNPLALERVLALFDAERGRKRLVFNGDFHWFDAEPAAFARIQQAVLAHVALRGNVETELANEAADADAGCGCAYPDWVGDGVVERSNRILSRLRQATTASQRAQLAALPMWLRADVGPLRLGLVHGDATSLAGWGFAQEHLRDAGHRAEVARWLDRAQVQAFASTHTCLPVFQGLAPVAGQSGPAHPQSARWVLNNGAAGMPNFRGDAAGLITRIATRPSVQPGVQLGTPGVAGPEPRIAIPLGGGVVAEAIPIDTDAAAWRQQFEALWPAGSDAHASYFDRIAHGPAYQPDEVVRPWA